MKVEPQPDGTILIRASDEGASFVRTVQSVTGPINADDDYRPYRPGSRTGDRSASDIPHNENMYDPREPLANSQDRQNALKRELNSLMASQPHLRFQQAWDQLQREKPHLFENMAVATHPD